MTSVCSSNRREDLLVGRNLLPVQDPTLGLIDDLRRQVLVVAQLCNDEFDWEGP